ncbi:MAG: outer membrane protein assembly factor BamE, partial [Gammaproteobacteria bacterium]|nr:outer membrane protein assembly factor BamE [Gammaproteobacteria bacterium]NNJ73206.1 outer membrane protein assembly factor BamE [Enterobacterales bacterium]
VDPLVYKLPKQQGNITDYKDIDKLEMGMNKAQVKFIMGTPMAVDSFNRDRWVYAYTYKSAKGDWTRNTMVLLFEEGRLNKIEGTPVMKRQEDKEITGQS